MIQIIFPTTWVRPLLDWHILHSNRLSLARLARRKSRRTWRPSVQPRGPWKIAATFPRVTTRSLQHTRRTYINRQQVSAPLARGLTDFIVYSVTHTLAHGYILAIASSCTRVRALVCCPIYCNDGNWWFRHDLPAACKNEGGGVRVGATSIGPKTVGWPHNRSRFWTTIPHHKPVRKTAIYLSSRLFLSFVFCLYLSLGIYTMSMGPLLLPSSSRYIPVSPHNLVIPVSGGWLRRVVTAVVVSSTTSIGKFIPIFSIKVRQSRCLITLRVSPL